MSEYSFNEYQKESRKTAEYKTIGHKIIYPTLGLLGETGEVAEKIKKIFRDHDAKISPEQQELLSKELGDVLWYLAQMATELDLTLENIAKQNLEKLNSRLERGVIHGSGDNR